MLRERSKRPDEATNIILGFVEHTKEKCGGCYLGDFNTSNGANRIIM